MQKIGQINSFPVYTLTREIAEKHVHEIVQMVDSIPLVPYTAKEVLAESKEDREFIEKWKHSLIVFDDEKPVAAIFAYERKAEDTGQYLINSLYISELAVHEAYRKQGIARKLLQIFLDQNAKFLTLDGPFMYSVQTNSADWNQHVIELYQSFGFKKTSTKKYDNRVDVVLCKK